MFLNLSNKQVAEITNHDLSKNNFIVPLHNHDIKL